MAVVLAQVAPRLEEYTPPPAAPAVEDARPLPAVSTICRGVGTPCWTEPGRGECAGGSVFLVVPAGEAAAAQRRCEEQD